MPLASADAGRKSQVDKLLLLLASISRVRAERSELLRELVVRCDHPDLIAALSRQRLLPLGGRRLEEHAGDLLTPAFRDAAEQATQENRRHAVVAEGLTLRMLAALDASGVRAMSLKGPFLARALYGDPAMRMSDDIDLLVAAENLSAAKAALRGGGYRPASEPDDRLPILHSELVHEDAWMPRVELHWRVHWYETSFSRRALERAEPGPEGILRPRPVDELAMLLLYFARDGFFGLRLAADVAAWFDTRSVELPPDALARVADEHPGLRSALVTSAHVAERLVGVPAEPLGATRMEATHRRSLATRLANWNQRGSPAQIHANVRLIDGLLSPPGARGDYLRRNFVAMPAAATAGAALGPRTLAYLRYAGSLLARYGLALWSVRGGREWSAPPCAPI